MSTAVPPQPQQYAGLVDDTPQTTAPNAKPAATRNATTDKEYYSSIPNDDSEAEASEVTSPVTKNEKPITTPTIATRGSSAKKTATVAAPQPSTTGLARPISAKAGVVVVAVRHDAAKDAEPVDPYTNGQEALLPHGITGMGYAPHEYNSLRCFVRAVECDVDNAEAWDNIGTSLKDSHEQVLINLRRGDVCPEKGERIVRLADDALQISDTYYDPNDEDAIVAVVFNQQRCFIRSLELDPLVSACWNKLGTTIPSGSFEVRGSDATGTETFVELDMRRHLPFANSRKFQEKEEKEMQKLIAGGRASTTSAFAINANSSKSNSRGNSRPTSAARLNTSGGGADGKQDGEGDDAEEEEEASSRRAAILHLNKRDCFTRAISLDFRNAHAWYNLASLLTIKKMTIGTMLSGGLLKAGGDAAVVATPLTGAPTQQQQVAADPMSGMLGALTAMQAAQALKGAGGGEGAAAVGGAASKLVAAMKKGGDSSSPTNITPSASTSVASPALAADGSTFIPANAAAAAARPSVAPSTGATSALQPPSASAELPLPNDPYMATIIGPFGRRYYFDKKQCLCKVIECEPEDPYAWYNLACIMKRGETIDVNVKVFVGGDQDGEIAALNRDAGDENANTESASTPTQANISGASPKVLLEKVLQNRKSKKPKRRTAMRTVSVNAKTCCLNSLKASNYTDFYAWTKLGQVLGASDTASLAIKDPVTGQAVSSTVNGRECFLEALHLNPMYPNAWDGLATTLTKTDKFVFTHPPHSMWNVRYHTDLIVEKNKKENPHQEGGEGLSAAVDEKGNLGNPLQLVIIGTDPKGNPVFGPSRHAQSVPPNPLTVVPYTPPPSDNNNTNTNNNTSNPYPPLMEALNNAACWNKAIESDPRYTMAWSSLGYTMGKTEKYKVLGVERTQRDTYLAGIGCDDKGVNDKAWNGLGITLKASEQLNIKEDPSRPPPPPPPPPGMEEWAAKDITANKRTGKKEAYGRSVLCNPYNSSAWNNLGTTLGNTGSVVIDGVELYEQDCYLRAVSLNPNNSAGWDNLGSTVGNKKGVKKNADEELDLDVDDAASDGSSRFNAITATIIVNGIPYTRQQCYLKAVNCNKNNSSAWGKLSGTLREGEHVTVAGVEYDRLACIQKALQCDFDNSRAWNRLGKLIDNGACGTTEPHATHLEARALAKINKERAAAGLPPAETLAEAKGGATTVTSGMKKNVTSESEEEEDGDGAAAGAAAEAKRLKAKITEQVIAGPPEVILPYVEIQGKPYTARDCFARACECDASYTIAWYNLGTAIVGGEEVVMIKSKPYQKKNCFIKAIEADEANVGAWNNLGMSLSNTETVTFGPAGKEKTFDKLKCYVKALELEPTNAGTWTNVGCMLMSEAEVAANKEAEKALMLINAPQLTNNSSNTPGGGGGVRRPLSGARSRPTSATGRGARPQTAKPNNKLVQTSVVIGGVSYSQIDCFVEAVKHDFNNAIAWSGLGALLGKEGASDVGSPYVSSTALPQPDRIIPDAKLPQFQNQLAGQPLPLSKTAAARLANALVLHPLPISVSIRGEAYTKQMCYVRAVESDKHNAIAWNNLGTTIDTPEEEEQRRAERKAKGESLPTDNDPLPSGAVTVNGRSYTKCDCYLKAVMLDCQCARGWTNLGASMSATDVVQYNGMNFNPKKKGGFGSLPSVDEDGNLVENDNAEAGALGTEFTLLPGQTANTNILLSRTEVLSKAAELEPSNSDIWLSLALLGTFDAPRVRAANPHVYSDNMSIISTSSQHGRNEDLNAVNAPTIRIGGDELTRVDCLLNAIEADQTNTRAWMELAAAMREEEGDAAKFEGKLSDVVKPFVVEIHGEQYTKAAIEAKILTIQTPRNGPAGLPPRSNAGVVMPNVAAR